MKKLIALLLTMVMLCSVAAADMVTFNYDPSTAPYEGLWVDIGHGLMSYMPSSWLKMEVPADFAAQGMESLFQPADGSCALAVISTPALGSDGRIITDYDTLFIEYTAAGYVVDHVMLNGMHVLGYDVSELQESGLLILDGQGSMYTIGFAPVSEFDVGVNVLFSIQPIPAL